jgi:predicted Zn-dependent protease with MMP-like domain
MGLPAGDTLLGLYQGIPLHARGPGYTLVPPDRITLFREPILSRCGSDEQVVRQVRATLLHELGHHFGLPESELR